MKWTMQITKREFATILAALEYWKEELDEGQDWIPESLFFTEHSPLSIKEIDDLAKRLESENQILRSHRDRTAHPMKQMRLMVPTYNGSYFATDVEQGTKPEFGEPFVPVLIHSADGVRVVLGSHEYMDVDKSDIAVERQPNGWVIFQHPIGGSDPSGYVYFFDDGRSLLLKERFIRPDEGIQILEPGARIPEFDGPSDS